MSPVAVRRPAVGRVRVDEHVPGKTMYMGQCLHEWRPSAPGDEFALTCGTCRAACTKDRDGKVIAFDARLPLEPRRPRREKREGTGPRGRAGFSDAEGVKR